MRTTVELPLEIMRAAKARSAESGESLKSLLTRAVAAELQMASIRSAGAGKARVQLPMFGSGARPPVRVSNADLERVLADADAAGAARRPARAGRRRTTRDR